MFCPNCGNQLSDDSLFCGACGTQIAAESQQEVQEEARQEACNEPAAEVEVPAEQPDNGFVKFQKKVDPKKIMVIAAAVVAVLALFLGMKALFSKGGKDAYVYLTENGKYELITNLKKDDRIQIASSKSDRVSYDMVSFSPDGKYVYYYTKVDYYSDTGTLCRAQYSKLTEKGNRNEKYIETIATNVSLGFRFLDDGSILFMNGEDTLYHFDGKEKVQIAKDVKSYYTDGAKRVAYSTGNSYDGYVLYAVNLKDVENKTKLVSDYYQLISTADLDSILYTKEEDDGSETLYVVGFSKESQELASDVEIYRTGDKVYYTVENGTMLNPYDYVTDNYAAEDANVTKPDTEDFQIPYYAYDMVYGSDLKEEDFDELYTSCTRDLYWYGKSTWWCYSMEEAVNKTWTGGEGVNTSTQAFIDKFASTADENGYIKVTAEVKAALQEIQKYADIPENEWQWLWLCFNKHESGTTTDYDAYNAAYDAWEAAYDRIDIREKLQSGEYDYPVSTLYCYSNGAATMVSDRVLDVDTYSGALVYNTIDTVTDKLSIENVDSVYDILDLFELNRDDENYIVCDNGAAYRMSASAADTYAEAYDNDYAYLYYTPGMVYMCEDNGALSAAKVSGGIVGDFTIISDDAEVMGLDGDAVYYAVGSYESNGYTYGDLTLYSGGKTSTLARDIMVDDVSLIYEDNVLMAYTGYRSGTYELTMFNSKGEGTLIADGVSQFVRVDKNLTLYIADGDLYSYNGKNKDLIRTDVDYLWTIDEMAVTNVLYG